MTAAQPWWPRRAAQLAAEFDLNDAQARVLAAVAASVNQAGETTVSEQTIARLAGKSERSARRLLSELRDRGILVVELRGRQSALRRINGDARPDHQLAFDVASGAFDRSPGGRSSSTGQPARSVHLTGHPTVPLSREVGEQLPPQPPASGGSLATRGSRRRRDIERHVADKAAALAACRASSAVPVTDQRWVAIDTELQRSVDQGAYRMWLGDLHPLTIGDELVVVHAPPNLRARVVERFSDALDICVAVVLGPHVGVEVRACSTLAVPA